MALTKKEADGEHPSSHYLIVTDEEHPTTWHLRVKDTDGKPDHRLMGAAWAALHGGYRGNKYEGPDKAEAIKKLEALYKGEDMELPGETASEYSRAVELLCLGELVEQPSGKKYYEIPVAVTGSWVKDGDDISITRADFADMVANFEKRKNHAVEIDYEHASEDPQIARGGPIPAAGWIRALSMNGELKALVEWTPQAQEMIRTAQYRFFSPAINWRAKDKQTGKPQGATLTSGALTNHPFLEELPPIVCSEKLKGENRMAEQKESGLPKLSARKGRKGSQHEGRHVFSDGDADVGYMSDDDFRDYAAQHGKDGDSAKESKDDLPKVMAEIFAEAGVAGLSSRGGLMAALERLREADECAAADSRRKLLFSEAVKEGKLDRDRAKLLAREGKVALDTYIAAEEAERVIDAAIAAGKILPRDRAFFFSDALERPKEFAEFVQHASAVPLGVSGITNAGDFASADDEIVAKTRAYMTENKLPDSQFGDAMKKVLASDRDLAGRYDSLARERTGRMAPNSSGAN